MNTNILDNIEGYEFSEKQKNLWQIGVDNTEVFYNQILLQLENEISSDRLLESIKLVIEKHEVLSYKTHYDLNFTYPIQFEAKQIEIDWHVINCEDNQINDLVDKQLNYSYDSSKNEPIRFCFVKIAGKIKYIGVRLYSLWGDAYSCQFLCDQLSKAILHGETYKKEEIEKINYTSFCAWQNELINEPEEEAVFFWNSYNHKIGEKIIPFYNFVNTGFKPQRKQIHLIEGDSYINLKNFCKENSFDIENVLLFNFVNYLFSFTENDITIGYQPFERNYEQLKNTLGLVSNTIPVVFEKQNELSINEAISYIATQVAKVSDWADYFTLDRENKMNQLNKTIFNYCFEFINLTHFSNNYRNLFKIIDLYSIQDSFELKTCFVDNGVSISVELYYNEECFKHSELNIIEIQLKERFKSLPISKINDFEISEVERLIIEDSNSTKKIFKKYNSINELFENQVELYPNNIALTTDKLQINYSELNIKVNQFKNYLIEQYNIKQGDAICVLGEASEWFVVSILGILKTGAYYIPIDINYPKERIQHILEESECKVIISDYNILKAYDFSEIKVLVPTSEEIYNVSRENYFVKIKEDDIAYCIYTSGSTGKPKGCTISHANLLNYIQWANEFYFENDDSGNWGLITSISFDLSVTALFTSLTRGKKLWIGNHKKDISELLKEAFNRSDIDTLKLTPAHISLLKELNIKDSHIKRIICGGEQLLMHQISSLRDINNDIRIYNEYGPTETTVGCIVKEITYEDSKVVIGKPIANTTIYILSDSYKHCQIGVLGEVYIGGSGLARGYLNRPDLTIEKFVDNPFKVGDRLYKTGDLACWLPDGNIEYKGRQDDQVKIKGHRVELGEIEQFILTQDSVSQSVILLKGQEEDKYIVAYIVSESVLDKKALQSNLSNGLPDYMLPRYYVQLEKIPLTVNGKIDKKGLLAVEEKDLIKEEYLAPRTIEENILVSVWSDVLKREKIGVNDSFYNLGGDSIKSIQVISRLKQLGYTLKVENILRTPFVAELAKLLKSNTTVIDQSEVKGEVGLTPIQHYFFENPNIPNKHYYNQSVLLKSREHIDQNILERCISELVIHHDALRMVYREEGNSWKQYNQDISGTHYKIEYYDLQKDTNELETLNRLGGELQSNFDISSGPIFHVGHFRLSDGDRLALIIHHLVVDGISWRILLEDLSNLYELYQVNGTVRLPLKTDSFQHWSLLQNQYSQGEKLKLERQYWEGICNETIPMLSQDMENIELEIQYDGGKAFILDKNITEKLQTIVHGVYNTEINDVLLTGLGLAIQDVFGLSKSVLMLEGHGREEIIDGVDIGRTIGWFTSLYPFILDVATTENQLESLVQVKEALRKIPNKGIGYGILKYIEDGFTNEISPSILFNYLGDFGDNVGDREHAIFEYASETIGTESETKNGQDALLNVSGMMVSNELRMSINYSGSLYHSETIERLIDSYQRHLQDIIEELSTIKESYLTPSDTTFKGLTISELSKLNLSNNIEDIYELSPLQQGIYYHWSLEKSTSMYFEQISYRLISKDLDLEAVNQAYSQLVLRHSVLRTSFTNNYGGVPLQIVHKSIPSNFTYEQVSDVVMVDEYIEIIKEKDKSEGFDLEQPSQMRLKVLDLGTGKFEFIWSHHHIIMDGWCMSILINDFYSLLNAISQKKHINLPPPIKYSKYIDWLSKIDKNHSLDYWKTYLNNYENVTEIPFKRKNTRENSYSYSNKSIMIEEDLYERTVLLCNDLGITHNTFIQTIWGVLLSQYNNTQDAVFGSVVSGRPGELLGVEDIVGLFSNTIPVRITFEKDETPKELLKKMHEDGISSKEHHYLNLSEVQSQSELGMQLINHIMIFENYPIQETIKKDIEDIPENNNELVVESISVFEQNNYDFTIIITPLLLSLKIEFKYNSNKYVETFIENLSGHFHSLLEQFVINIDRPLNTLNYLTEKEEHQLLIEFNDTDVAYLKDKTIVDLFEEQVIKTPNNVALIFEEVELTYNELNEQTNQLASFLRDTYAIQANDLIGIKLERSEKMIITLLGILKSGAAYVPIDPSYPQERITYIQQDSNCKVVLDGVALERFTEVQEKYSKENLEKINQPNDLAYVIYTSGTTGNPKGVMIENCSLTNFLDGMNNSIPSNENDHLLAITSVSFDISILELFWTLTRGITITLKSENTPLNNFDIFLKDHLVALDFSLFYFSSQNDSNDNKYQFLKESTVYADENNFSAVWLPERHFHEFGGIFPNPSVLGAGLSTITKNIEIRSGSIVLPLHDVVRVAEEWSVVDNLSDGRVALSVASGWNANDFVLQPQNYSNRHQIMYSQIEELKTLWQGESIKRQNGLNQEFNVRIYPKPVSPNLDIYITSAGNSETFISAGKIGANILTHLLGQNIKDLENNIRIYKQTLKENGYPVETAKIALMLHTYIGTDLEEVKSKVKQPFKSYLKSSAGLIQNLAKDLDKDIVGINEDDLNDLLELAFERYWQTAALLGTKDSCKKILSDIHSIGVTEIACLVDFGVDDEEVLKGLKHLTELKDSYKRDKKMDHSYNNPISSMQITPSYLEALLEDESSSLFLKSLKNIIVGGERFSNQLLNKLRARTKSNIYNMYGPTETTIWSTFQKAQGEFELNIGKPIQNTQIYILDDNKKICPIGVIGELCIGGEGLARGYYKNEKLTSDKFVNFKLSSTIDKRVYKTGDLARWLPDGNLEHLGRLDDQVKINGFRIELGEIESVLRQHESINQVNIIVAQNENANKSLLAYFISDKKIKPLELREYIQRKLPYYMVPNNFIQIDEFPLTPNGKINKKMLSSFEEVSTDKEYVAPQNDLQSTLIDIWSKVLNIETDKIGVKDNFFELGGNSLNALQVLNRIRKQLNISVSLNYIFDNRNILELAKSLEFLNKETEYAIENQGVTIIPVAKKASSFALSRNQRRMWLLSQSQQGNMTYSIVMNYKILGKLNVEILQEAYEVLLSRHQILRTIFIVEEGEPRQKIISIDSVDKQLRFYNLSEENDVYNLLNEEANQPMDLVTGPLVKASIIQINKSEYYFQLINHHIISDGPSMTLLFNELVYIYSNIDKGTYIPLPALSLQYSDYAEWQNDLIINGKLAQSKKYWTEKLNGTIPISTIPIDFQRSEIKTFEGGSVEFEMNGILIESIRKTSLDTNTTPYIIALTALKILIDYYNQNEDIIVGTDFSGRVNDDIENMIGMFINIMALRSYPVKSKTFYEYLLEVKRIFIDATEHQEYQFDDIVNDVIVNRDMSRNPFFDINFVMQNFNMDVNMPKALDIEIEKISILKEERAAFDISFFITDNGKSMDLNIIYNTNLYKEKTIRVLGDQYVYLLDKITNNIDVILLDLNDFIESFTNELKKNSINTIKNKNLHGLKTFKNNKSI